MIRQKIVIGDYAYIVEYYKAHEDLIENPHRESFYILKNYSVLSDITIDKDIYFINSNNKNKIIYPMPHDGVIGYSLSSEDFNSNINKNNFDLHKFLFYDKNNLENEEYIILCDKIKIYFPSINPYITGIIDVNNFINDIEFHYLVNDIYNYTRYSDSEFEENHNIYSEYIEIYIPSINELLYNDDIFIKDYNVNSLAVDSNNIDSTKEEDINIIYNNESYIPYNLLYYPYRILEYKTESEENLHKKSYLKKERYINNQFYSTFNIVLYPYSDIDAENKFVIDDTYSSATFNIDLSFSLITKIRFPYLNEIINDKYYGVPIAISAFKYPKINNETLLEAYFKYNGLNIEDYDSWEDNIEYDNDELFNEDNKNILKTGFYIEMAKDPLFKNIFFKYSINIDDTENIIDDLIFPLNDIFSTWDDVPNLIIYRVTFIDKVACIKISSNDVIINTEWYKYLVDGSYKAKLKLNNIYKANNMNPINKEDLLFIDKINCNVIKSSDSDDNYSFYKSSSPKVIYKPIFFRTNDLQNISIKKNVKQNIGINLGEYMSKVETFKLTIDDNEYIEYGRNDIFVIFNINSKNITSSSGTYIITNEDDDFVSDGSWTLV